MAVDMQEATYASRYSAPTVGIVIHRAGVPADPDAATVTVSMVDEETSTPVFSGRTADREEAGVFSVTLSTAETSVPGMYRLTWDYAIDGAAQSVPTFLEVGQAAPAYDALDVGMQGVVEDVWGRFADLYDSPYGGPHLQVYFQTHFGRQRLAKLLRTALGRLNTASQPYTTYTLEGPPAGKQFPLAKWGPLLSQALYIEVLKHLRRSYVEQPEAVGVNTARLDRRDYLQRWGEILRDEEDDLRTQLSVFKIAHMNLGHPRVVVAGGIYGNFGVTREGAPLSAAARPRYYARYY